MQLNRKVIIEEKKKNSQIKETPILEEWQSVYK